MKRKVAALLVLLVAGLGTALGKASPYTINFNVPISTSDHDFAVATGWGHLVDKYVSSYVRYTYHADGGADNSGCLEIGSQHLYDGSFDDGDMTDKVVSDMLVTPPVEGKVTLKAKKTLAWSSDFGVKFYTLTKTDGKWIVGSEITPSVYNVNNTEFTTVELPSQPAGTYIGIRGYNVRIDDFSAESADVELKRGLQVVSAEWAGGKYCDIDADGNFNIAYKFVLQNTGDYTLNPGDEGYSVDLKRNVIKTTFATLAPTKALQPGEYSDTLLISAVVSQSNLSSGKLFPVLRENVTGTQLDLPQLAPTPHKADFSLTGAYGTTPLQTGYHIDFGTSRSAVTVPLLLRNNGAVEQAITEIKASEGFAASLKAPLTIAPHDSILLNVSLTPDTKGEKTGTLTVKGDNGVDVVLDLMGISVADNQTFYDFEDGKVGDGFVTNDAWHISSMPQYIYSINNRYCVYTSHQDTVSLILPKMEVKAGDKMSFECSKGYTHSFVDVLYSADRKHWQLAKSVQVEEMSDSALAPTWGGYYYAMKRFTVDDIPAGQWYIAFSSGNSYVDNILADYSIVPTLYDGYFGDVVIRGRGKVGQEMEARAVFHNVMSSAVKAGDYSISLVIGDKEYPVPSGENINGQETAVADLWLRPAEAGTFSAFWRFKAGSVTIDSDPVQMTVEEKDDNAEVLTEHPVHHQYTTSAPMDPYNFNGESEFIYLPSEIRLPKGTRLTSLSWYGMNARVAVPLSVQLYLQNTSDTVIKPGADGYAMTDASSMTKVYDGLTQLEIAGSTYVYDKVITVYFDKPFYYDGGPLRIQFHGSTQSGPRVFFAANKGYRDQMRSIARNNANASSLASTTIYADALPVIAIGYSDASTITGIGTVKAAEGMTVPEYYNMSGMRLSAPVHGINIVRKPDGTVRKVLKR